MKRLLYTFIACAAMALLSGCGARSGGSKQAEKGKVAEPDTTTFIDLSEGDIDESGDPMRVTRITISPEGDAMVQTVLTFGYNDYGLVWMESRNGTSEVQRFEAVHDGYDAVSWTDPWGRTTKYSDETLTSVSTMDGGNTVTNHYTLKEGRVSHVRSENVDYPYSSDYEWNEEGDIMNVTTKGPDGAGSVLTYARYSHFVNCISDVDLISVILSNSIDIQDLRCGFTSTHFPLEMFDAGQEYGETVSVSHYVFSYEVNENGLPVKIHYGFGAEDWTEWADAYIEYNQ